MGMIEVSRRTAYRTEQDHELAGKDGKVLVERLIRSFDESHMTSEREMDAFLAGELNQMSLQERQKAFEEIHGVDNIIEETPEFIEESLAALDAAVSKIHPKEAYEMAENMNFDYVHDESFRLTFLRADMFDEAKAARRLVIFFECRLALFGPDLMTRSLTIKDLDADDMATLKSGYFQILPSRDTTGRAVLANVQGMFKRSYKRAVNMLRAYHYLMCSMVEDLETQRHGSVIIMYQIGNFEYDPPPDIFKGGTSLVMRGSPVRICGMHMCLDHPVMKAMSRVVLGFSGRETRARYRFHEGSHTEVQYRLLSFGIPVDLLPITAEGELKKTNHVKWLAMRKAKESSRRATALQFASTLQGPMDLKVELPGRNDVLMGKGKPVQEHYGNVAMRAMVGLYMSEYNTAAKHCKINFVKKVQSAIPGRFLKKNSSGWWVLASEAEARDKISKTFTSEQAKAKRVKMGVQTLESEIFAMKRARPDEWSCFSGFPGFGCDKSNRPFPSEPDFGHLRKRQK